MRVEEKQPLTDDTHSPPPALLSPDLVLLAGPRGPRSAAGDLRLQRQQRVEQRARLGDLAGDVGVGVLAEHLGVLRGRQLAHVFPVGGLGPVPGDVVGGQGREPAGVEGRG